MKKFFLQIFFLGIVAALCAFQPEAAFASSIDGTVSGYAWGDRLGWINFGCTNCNVHVTDSGLTGYAWSQNYGWINLNATTSGVDNNAEGALSGKAWGEKIGWINFSGVTISSSGAFGGTAIVDEGGSISFGCTNCNMTTDWRPLSTRSSGGGGGGGGSVSGGPISSFNFTINRGASVTNRQEVQLFLGGGSAGDSITISNTADFSGATKEPYAAIRQWTLSQGDGVKTVYLRYQALNSSLQSIYSSNITLDVVPSTIQISTVKDSYGNQEQVMVAGTADPNVLIEVFIDANYATTTTNQYGNWAINFGILSEGSHSLELVAVDAGGNKSQPVKAQFSVRGSMVPLLPQMPIPTFPPVIELPPFTLAPPIPPIFKELADGIQALLPKIFQPIGKDLPQIVTVPQEPSLAFNGSFTYLSSTALAKFVLAPLPKDLQLLAQKLPQVQKTFSEVGVQKITDVQKLKNIQLKLPSLTESLFPETSLATGTLADIKGVPVALLSPVAKSKIPSEIVFVKAGGGLVDFNVALSVSKQGKVRQTIETIVGYPIELVVKADKPVKKVTGYMVFKSKKSPQKAAGLPLENMTASLLFANPELSSEVGFHQSVALEGLPLNEKEILHEVVALSSVAYKKEIEQRLVLSTFEYLYQGDEVYTVTILAPPVDGNYEIITVMDYEDDALPEKEIALVTVVDPEGYIYEKDGNRETRIPGAVAALYWLNPNINEYELWPAEEFQQENPQVTDSRGTYSFLVPTGYYYLKVDAPGYTSYESKPFEVNEGSGVHMNIELKGKNWFLKMVDWKTLLLVAVILLLLYNFYKDKMREKIVGPGQQINQL